MSDSRPRYRFRTPLAKPEEKGGAPPCYRRSVIDGVLIERDVAVSLRDGIRIYVDVYRPADAAAVPPIIAWGPYGKHGHTRYSQSFPKADVADENMSRYTAFEAPDPIHWVSNGYAVINADPRGTWYSEGDATYLSPEEARDFHDLIEWAGVQPWSNGKVGLSGVSYLTSSQWRVAETNPPHLAAINLWEGWTDTYREVVRHGGIPETSFWPYLPTRWGHGTNRVEDLRRETEEHPFFDQFWTSKAADFSRIQVPAYVVASWSDQGLHTRGTLEGFKGIASRRKWLEVHGRKKWAYYYDPESVRRQIAFFDHFLKGQSNEVTEWPPVRLEVRDRYYEGSFRSEAEWPIARTRYTPLFLEPAAARMQDEPIAEESVFRYDADGESGGPVRAQFDHRFAADTELIGHMKLRLWMAAEGADDMDVFVAIQKLDSAGEVIPFAYYAQYEDGPVALGWQRASHRELDIARSTPQQPVLAHRRERKVEDGEIVPLEIEIWPSGTRFAAGDTLCLVVQGSDIYTYPKPSVYARHEDLVNRGAHVIHGGGRYDSHLLVPVVPK
jgi:predicted acyl esterase